MIMSLQHKSKVSLQKIHDPGTRPKKIIDTWDEMKGSNYEKKLKPFLYHHTIIPYIVMGKCLLTDS